VLSLNCVIDLRRFLFENESQLHSLARVRLNNYGFLRVGGIYARITSVRDADFIDEYGRTPPVSGGIKPKRGCFKCKASLDVCCSKRSAAGGLHIDERYRKSGFLVVDSAGDRAGGRRKL